MNPVTSSIRQNLEEFDPIYLEVINESYMHNVPDGSESHFKVVVVSKQFEQQMLVARNRMINESLKEQIGSAVHALSIQALTPDEWFECGGKSAPSPQCLGGNKL